MNCSCYELLKKNFLENGDFIAYVDKCNSFKLSEMIDFIDNFSCYILSLGINFKDCVSICLPNSFQFIVAFYALNKIGVKANLIHSLSSIEYIHESVIKTNSKALITDNTKVAFSDVHLIPANNMLEFESNHSINNKTLQYNFSNDEAVYINSGGTSGKQKTVILTNNNINTASKNISFVLKETVYGKEFSLFALPASHSFGLVTSMHFPLINGMGLAAVEKFSPDCVTDLIKLHNVTYLTGVPEMYSKLYEYSDFHGPHLKKIKNAFCGGDFVPNNLIKKYNELFTEYKSESKLYAGYGMSETSSVCCLNSKENFKIGSVGKPAGEIKISAGTEDNPEEIRICSETVMKEYLDCSETLFDEDKEKWFKTGDIGYIDDDGFLFITGRKKRVIIISGYNIYPSDIEKTALSVCNAKEACAVERFISGKKKIVLYMSGAKKIKENTVKDISDKIENCLSSFHKPGEIIFVNELPKTELGKIDYRKLEKGEIQ